MRRSASPEPPAPRYTRLRGWFQSGESAWSLVAKFQLLNCLSLEQLLELVRPAEQRAREPLSFRFAQRFDLARLAALLDVAPEVSRRAFLAVSHRAPAAPLVARSVRFCARCLLAGWHLTLSQWRFLRRCPIHRSPLSGRCPCCRTRASLDFRLDIALALRPYACPACGQRLAPVLDAPRGRPQAMSSVQCAQVEHWTRTIEHYLAAFSPLPDPGRVRSDDQAADLPSARRTRWSFLAEIVGVARRAPPAWPRSAVPELSNGALEVVGRDGERQVPLAWQARLWPHFDRDFAAFAKLYGRQCEQLAQRIHLDPDTSQRLAIDSAADRRLDPRPLCVDTLAYWLWRMAWEGTGSLRLLHAREHPPFGLAAWLAYAPVESAALGEAHQRLAHVLHHHLRESFEYARALVLWMRDERRLFMMPKLLAPQLWWVALRTPG